MSRLDSSVGLGAEQEEAATNRFGGAAASMRRRHVGGHDDEEDEEDDPIAASLPSRGKCRCVGCGCGVFVWTGPQSEGSSKGGRGAKCYKKPTALI